MLIEFHILQNHAPSNLNRDDSGSPKQCTFGGIKRGRISSQCLKRSIRSSAIFQSAFEGNTAVRTRHLPELVEKELIRRGVSAELASAAAKKATGFGNKDGKEQTKNITAQTMFLTSADIAAITDVLYDAATKAGTPAKLEKEKAADLQASAKQRGYRPITVDVALFGRMTTSEAVRDVEASMQVAHAISTHYVDNDFDYFTAVDDLQKESLDDDSTGAGMIGDIEFNSSCYYKYFSLDLDNLVNNLTGTKSGLELEAGVPDGEEARMLAVKAAVALLQAAVFATPSGKQNSFAAHQLPDTIVVEIRKPKIPVSYANAFAKPAKATPACDIITDSRIKLKQHIEQITKAYNLSSEARLVLCPLDAVYTINGASVCEDVESLCSQSKEALSHG